MCARIMSVCLFVSLFGRLLVVVVVVVVVVVCVCVFASARVSISGGYTSSKLTHAKCQCSSARMRSFVIVFVLFFPHHSQQKISQGMILDVVNLLPLPPPHRSPLPAPHPHPFPHQATMEPAPRSLGLQIKPFSTSLCYL